MTVVTGCGAVLASRHGCTRKARFWHAAQTPGVLVQEGHGVQKPMHAWLPCCLSAWCGSIWKGLAGRKFWESVNWTVLWGIPNFGGLPVQPSTSLVMTGPLSYHRDAMQACSTTVIQSYLPD